MTQLNNYALASHYQPVRSVTVIIPTLNEADYIEDCIRSLGHDPAVGEIVVADGGSGDSTKELSAAMGARVVSCRHKGRGLQIREGIQRSTGGVVLVMHADCCLRKGAMASLLDTLNGDSTIAGGAFKMVFTAQRPSLRAIAILNNLRARLTGISFGDQGQFARREALDRIGGFPELLLMEDVELSLRLKKVGRVVLLGEGMKVSARRWHRQAYLKRVLQVLYLFSHYLLVHNSRGGDRQAVTYYRNYYQ